MSLFIFSFPASYAATQCAWMAKYCQGYYYHIRQSAIILFFSSSNFPIIHHLDTSHSFSAPHRC